MHDCLQVRGRKAVLCPVHGRATQPPQQQPALLVRLLVMSVRASRLPCSRGRLSGIGCVDAMRSWAGHSFLPLDLT
jgi:hypothetical protein